MSRTSFITSVFDPCIIHRKPSHCKDCICIFIYPPSYGSVLYKWRQRGSLLTAPPVSQRFLFVLCVYLLTLLAPLLVLQGVMGPLSLAKTLHRKSEVKPPPPCNQQVIPGLTFSTIRMVKAVFVDLLTFT